MGSREILPGVKKLAKAKTSQSIWNEAGTDVSAGIWVRDVIQGWDHKFENQQYMAGG